MQTVRGRGAKEKGSRAERKWRDELRRIYKTPAQREKIKRVPMSGASWMKGDVVDLNDYDTLYEVKNCESLEIPAWWRQTERESGASRTSVLVVTQNFRPFYVFMENDALAGLYELAGLKGFFKPSEFYKSQKGLLDAIDRTPNYGYIDLTVGKDNINLLGIKGEDYIDIKKKILEFK